MNVRIASLGVLATMLPLAVEIPRDSSHTYDGVTRVRVGAGVGTYAFIARGCEGEVVDEVPAHFTDAGASLEHRVGGAPLVVGVRGGWVRHEIGTSKRNVSSFYGVPLDATVENTYVNPYLSIEGETAGVGGGPVFHRNEFITADEGAREQADHPLNDMSWHVRVGSPYDRHLVVQWMEGVPLSSGGGYFTALVGGPFDAHPQWTFRSGLGAGGPHEGAGLVLRLERVMPDGVSLDVTGRLGFSGSRFAGGAALGLTYALDPGSAPRTMNSGREAATDHE